MEIFIVILLIFILVLLFTSKNVLQEKIQLMDFKLDLIRKDLEAFKTAAKNKVSEEAKAEVSPASPDEVKSKIQVEIQAAVLPPKLEEEIKWVEEKKTVPEPLAEVEMEEVEETVYMNYNNAPPKEVKPSFFERHPDLEKFIGENLINKIGIAILVLGIGFFVKFAIDQNWINEIGRVFIGILCGGLLVGLAHKMRKTFAAFSSVLVGGGIAVFYFTIAIAFHEYQIFSQTTAFIIMVGITGFAILLSLAYNRIELAVIAIVGGFVSPFVLSTGEGNYLVLFSYILILDIGMLVLAYFKKWNLVNIISYLFTILIYGVWISTKLESKIPAPYAGALVFATLFYLVFFLMNIINNIKENNKFKWPEISILLSNTFLYYSAGMYILKQFGNGYYQGLFTVGVALFNFIFAFTLFKSKRADSNLVYLLIGLVLTFVSLAAPVQLEGNYITMFWAAEATLLLWLSQKSGIKLMEVAFVAVFILMGISLVMDWTLVYSGSKPLTIVFNKAGITTIVVLVLLALNGRLLKNVREKIAYILPGNFILQVLNISLFVALYFGGLLELNYQMYTRVEPYSMQVIVVGSYNLFFILAFQFLLKRTESAALKIAAGIAGILGSVVFLVYYHDEIIELRTAYLIGQSATFIQFLYHYCLTILATAILVVSLRIFSEQFGLKSKQTRFFLWYFVLAGIFILSAELDHLVVLTIYNDQRDLYNIISQNHKIGYPLLWGITSFICMYIGMKSKIKDLRIISLSLFLVILLKLFIIDLRGISEGGKIAAFISLGVLLLIVSFMYQRLKKLVTEEEVKNPGLAENV